MVNNIIENNNGYNISFKMNYKNHYNFFKYVKILYFLLYVCSYFLVINKIFWINLLDKFL